MKFRSFLVLFLLCCLNAYSQYEYRPGYIVRPGGKTEEGFIKFSGSASNARKCEFKRDMESDNVTYLPTEIEAYRIKDSKYFVSKRVSIDNVQADVFLECLISGVASVYYILWDSKDVFFLEKDGKLTQMNNNRIIYTDNESHDIESTTRQYIGILKYNFNDCPQITGKVENAEFTKRSLIKLSKEYNDLVCADKQCIIYEKKEPLVHVRLGGDLSYGISQMKYCYNTAFKFSPDITNYLQINLNAQIKLDEQGAFNLVGTVGYFGNKYKKLNSNTLNNYVLVPNDVHYSISAIRTSIQLKYKMRAGKATPYISLGFFTPLFLIDKGTITNDKDQTVAFSTAGFDYKRHLWLLGETSEIGVEIGKNPYCFSVSLCNDYYLSSPFSGSYNLGLKCGYYFK
jgi:hypothetical protein